MTDKFIGVSEDGTTYRKIYEIQQAPAPAPAPEEPAAVTLVWNVSEAQEMAGSKKITILASDPAKVASIQLFVDSAGLNVEEFTPYDFNLDTAAYIDGPHTLEAKVTLKAGGSFTESRNVSFKNATTTTPPAGGSRDKFAYVQIYPTKQGGEEWFMKMADFTPKETRFDPKATVTKNADGSFKCKSAKVRMNVFTSKGYHPEKYISNGEMMLNQKQLAERGYMQDPEDWKNGEMTGAVRVNTFAKMDNFAWYWRGGKHSDVDCEGTSYKNDLYYNGDNGWKKEQWHSGGYSGFVNKKVDAEIKAAFAAKKFVVFKAVNYNDKDGNVVLELHASLDDGKTFRLLNRRLDSGGWGNDGGHCDGAPDQKITWGGPIATFRWDNATDVDFKNFSMREIVPPT